MSNAIMPYLDSWDRSVGERMSQDGISSAWKLHDVHDHTWHRHIGLEALLCEQGEGVYSFGDRRIPYSAGSLILFDAQIPHRPQMSDNYVRWNICLWPPRLASEGDGKAPLVELSKLYPETGNVYHVRTSDRDFDRLHRVFQEIHEERKAKRKGYKALIQLRLAELLIWLDRHSSESNAAVLTVPNSSGPGTISDIVSYIERNVASDLSVASIADVFHYSTSHLYRLISQSLGQAPSQYIKTRRIAKAKTLLTESGLTVGEIAQAVGMSNGGNFSRLFRNETGESPTEYRERMRSVPG